MLSLEDQRIRCWGRNNYGQLFLGHSRNVGDDELPSSTTSLSFGESIRQLVLGDGFSCVLMESGRMKCWGYNRYGQLGLGHGYTIGDSSLETPGVLPFVNVGGKVTKIAAGTYHACALLEDKTLRCWGRNDYGQLGLGHTRTIGDNEHPHTLGQVTVGQNVRDVALGLHNTCALLEDGTVKCWGSWRAGILGNGQTNHIGDNELPSTVSALNLGGRVEEIKVSQSHACVVLENRKVKCWGEGTDGALANHSTGNINNVVGLMPLSLGRETLQISLGYRHSCALLDTGSVRCWGANNYGQLGLGHTTVIGDNEFPVERIASTFKDPGHVIIARFGHTVDSVNPLMVSFDARASFFKKTIQSYAWSFGDDMTGTGSTVSHTFAGTGTYTVGLTVTDNLGQTHQVIKKVVLSGNENLAPVIFGAQSLRVLSGQSLTFNLNSALDFDSTTLTYSVVNMPTQGTLSECLGGTSDLSCLYVAPADFMGQVTFSYKANDGMADSLPVMVRITVSSSLLGDRESAMELEGPIGEGFDFFHDFPSKDVFFDASSSFNEIMIFDYFWDFGDGHTATGQTAWHTFESPGSYVVTLTVTDFDLKTHSLFQDIVLKTDDGYEEEHEQL